MKKLYIVLGLLGLSFTLNAQSLATYRDQLTWSQATNNLVSYDVVLTTTNVTAAQLGVGAIPTSLVLNTVKLTSVSTQKVNISNVVPASFNTGFYRLFVRGNTVDVNSDWVFKDIKFAVIPAPATNLTISVVP